MSQLPGKGNRKRFIRYLPIYGCISTGVIYVAVGVIAILSLLRIKQGGASENSFLLSLSNYTFGNVLVFLILLGMLSYFAWRIYESVKDPYKYGSNWRGLGHRAGICLSSLADGLIAYSAFMVLLGLSEFEETGRPEQQREMIGGMLHKNWGEWLVISLGIVIMGTALVQLFYGMTRGYRERLDIARYRKEWKKLIFLLAKIGYLCRGIILGIIGFFFIKAGFTDNEQYVVNTDKAFNFIGDHWGKLPFALVAVGTVCYGLFMFAMGFTYDVDNDPTDPGFG
ncbi:DUF1206 domain-containing protein [Zunongwangia sp. F363]|uniref:DUF1206 domain-containing protein n=1 Tax=Autumnicola tepida TaxID=3075595 RepID=A0ABU3C7Y5_9FLAO|nr:DUF1206 domain-containing protein [Zunongwangia sp. F363]MDT0642454.1 DUF1206 domain-containing protein [Zunongwangia sp. F363]